MKKIIAKKTYNTDTADLIKKIAFGQFGDDNGYEETLYKTKTGNYFIYGIGGNSSPYPEETIVPLNNEDAAKWQLNN